MRRRLTRAAVFTTEQAPGAWLNGTRVAKCQSAPGDAHQDGALATVLGSMGPADVDDGHGPSYAYFVEWDDHPGVPVGIAGWRLRLEGGKGREAD